MLLAREIRFTLYHQNVQILYSLYFHHGKIGLTVCLFELWSFFCKQLSAQRTRGKADGSGGESRQRKWVPSSSWDNSTVVETFYVCFTRQDHCIFQKARKSLSAFSASGRSGNHNLQHQQIVHDGICSFICIIFPVMLFDRISLICFRSSQLFLFSWSVYAAEKIQKQGVQCQKKLTDPHSLQW